MVKPVHHILSLWHSDAIQNSGDNRVRVNTVGLGFETQDQPVAQHIGRDRLNILGSDKITTGEPGVGATFYVSLPAVTTNKAMPAT